MQIKKLVVINLVVFLLLNAQVTISQEKEDLKTIFVEAESYFLYEEYNEALALYLKLVRVMPENANINYKLGRCYLHSDYKKELSIPYLEKASKRTTDKYKIKSFKEINAPLEVFYYLGEAYRVTNQLDKALETYTYFLGIIDDEVYDKKLVKDQIDACNRAKEKMNNPVYFEARNLGNKINTSRKQSHPVLSGDGKQLAFVTKLPFYDAIFYTEKDGDGWKEPRNLTPEIKVDGATYPTCMSYDGKEMYLYKLDNYNGNLYVTRLENNKWTEPVELKDINTKYWESHASISKDKQTLYFTSNMPGGYGELDIYVSKRISDFKWGEPQNLGPTINSRYNDDIPFITPDGKSLYFASLGHKTMGGYDIFISDFKDSEWTEPKNIGYPINTTSDELFFMPFKNGISGYMPMIRKDGFGLYDIYEIEIFSEKNPRRIKLTGRIKNASGDIDFDKLLVEVFDKSGNKKISETNVDNDGTFELFGQSGDVRVEISGRGIKDYSAELNIPHSYDRESFLLEPELEKSGFFSKEPPKEERKEPYLEIDSEVIELSQSGPVEIRFRADRGVEVEVYAVNSGDVYFKNNFTTRRKRNSITINPHPGKSTVTIKVADGDGNTIEKEIIVLFSQEGGHDHEAEIIEATPGKIEKNIQDDDFLILLNDLLLISGGNLSTALKDMKSDPQINSLGDIIRKLYQHSEKGLFSKDDINDLLARYAVHLVENYNIKQIRNLSKDELESSLNQILANDSSITGSGELVARYLALLADFDKENLLPVLVNLAKHAATDFESLNHILMPVLEQEGILKVAEKAVGKEFNDINLYNYFDAVISGDNAKETYQNILSRLLLEAYIKNAYEMAEGDLKTVFEDLQEDGSALKNSQELVAYLFEHSENIGISKDEVIRLLFKLNKSIHGGEVDEETTIGKFANESRTTSGKQFFWFASGGLILIIWLILFLRRKKNKGTN